MINLATSISLSSRLLEFFFFFFGVALTRFFLLVWLQASWKFCLKGLFVEEERGIWKNNKKNLIKSSILIKYSVK